VIEFEQQAGERYRSAIAWRVRRDQIESALGQDIRRCNAEDSRLKAKRRLLALHYYRFYYRFSNFPLVGL